jgi:predicted nucleic-acid-binding Zn-ribbon protein
MKETKTCPKCNSQDILRIPYRLGTYNHIPAGFLDNVPITRYVCSQCGFSEEWIDSSKDLAKLKQKYG